MEAGAGAASVNETLAALAAMLRRERVLLPEEAMAQGFASIDDIAKALHISVSAARNSMRKLEQQGKVEQVLVKRGRAIVGYWRVKD